MSYRRITGKSGIRALGRMWNKASENESVNEDVFAIVDKYNDKETIFQDNNLNKVKKQ